MIRRSDAKKTEGAASYNWKAEYLNAAIASLSVRKVANVKGLFNTTIDKKVGLFKSSSKKNIATSIFGNDNKRKSLIDDALEAEFFPEYRAKLIALFENYKHSVSTTTMIFNRKDCLMQDKHQDNSNSWRNAFLAKISYSVIVAVMSGTRIIGYINNEKVVFELEIGDMLIFTGDFEHSGADYHQFNVRLHWYVDFPGNNRKEGKTYLPQDNDYISYENRIKINISNLVHKLKKNKDFNFN
jgi:hypothetical protein